MNQTLKEYRINYANQQPSPLAYLIFRTEERKSFPLNNLSSEKEKEIRETDETLIEDTLPSGSGIDANITIESATKNKITLLVPFHHMNEHGFYCEWIDYRIKITVDFTGLSISISNTTTKSGDKYLIYDYLCDTFLNAFEKEL